MPDLLSLFQGSGHTFVCECPKVQHLSTNDYHQQCVNDAGPIGTELAIRSLR